MRCHLCACVRVRVRERVRVRACVFFRVHERIWWFCARVFLPGRVHICLLLVRPAKKKGSGLGPKAQRLLPIAELNGHCMPLSQSTREHERLAEP